MQRMPGSQLCFGQEGVEEWDIPAARQKRKNDYWGLSCSGGGSEIPTRRCTVDLLGICQQVPQIPTSSLAQEDVLLWNGAGHQQVNAANGGQYITAVDPGVVAPQAVFWRWP